MGEEVKQKKNRIRGHRKMGKKLRFLSVFLVFSMIFVSIPETVFAETEDTEFIFAGMDGMEPSLDFSLEAIDSTEEFSYPTGDLIYDVQEISEEEIPDDVPVYGNFSVFSRARANEVPLVEEIRYGYQQLSENQQAFYKKCLAEIAKFLEGDYKTKTFTVNGNTATLFGVDFSSYGLSAPDVVAVFFCLRNDYPEYYWLYYGCRYTTGSEQVLYFMTGEEYCTAAKRVATQEAIDRGIEEYLAEVESRTKIENKSDDYTKIRIIHDKLILDVKYARKANGQPEDALWAHSIAGVFDGNAAVVCEGYSKTLQYVLNELEIENIYMTGTADGGDHAWSGVKVDNQWFYVDATWDDTEAEFLKEVGLLYSYFMIPAPLFERSHKVDNPDSKSWLYEIPVMSDSKDYTFYAKYGCDFTNIRSVEEATTKLNTAGGSVPGQYIHALVNENTKTYLSQANGGLELGVKVWDGYSVFFIDATEYKVEHPAIQISVTGTAIELDRDLGQTAVFTATLTAANGECDDVVRWSSSSSCVELTPHADGRSVTVTAKRNGEAIITATAVKGKKSASITITVIGTKEYQNIYLDASFTAEPEEEDLMVWVNGGNIKFSDNTRYNYKMRSLYTNIKPSKITTKDSRGRIKTKNGKLVAGITLSAEPPTLVKGKIVDTEAAKIAKATVNAKTGLIKVTAQKKTGEVYLWVMDTGDDKAVAYAKLTVTAAPAKILLNDKDYSTSGRAVVKKQTLAIGESMGVFLEPLLASKGAELAQGGSYSVTFSKNGEKYVNVEPIAGALYGYRITPVALDAAKPGRTLNVRVNFVCNENNKKTSLAITITNPMASIAFAAGTGLVMTAQDTFTVNYSETQAQNLELNFTALPVDPVNATTDKPKLSAVSGANGVSIDAKGKLVAAKPTGEAAKLKASFSRDKKSIVVKVPKKLAVGTKNYFVLFYNKDCYRICSVEVVGQKQE